MRLARLLYSWTLCLLTGFLPAQPPPLPPADFRSPLDFDIKLSGTFGELRANHFHMGLDIKTFGEGKKVYAVADGTLARIKISQYGYGKALYLNHSGGYTTVYAHLSRFNTTLEKFVKEQQYKMKTEEIDIAIPDSVVTFFKGQVIAYTGNTGSSEAPHLHFEIRDTKTDDAFNPLLFNLHVPDSAAPNIYGIKIYPVSKGAHVNGGPQPVLLAGSKVKCTALGQLAIGVQTNDYMGGNRNGIFEITIQVNGKNYFQQRLDRIDYATTRYINTYMDYSEFHNHSRHIHKCYRYGNNQLKIYPIKENDGIITVNENDSLLITVIVKDVKGNIQKAKLTIKGENKIPPPMPQKNCTALIQYTDSLEYDNDGFRVTIDKGTVYDSACIEIGYTPAIASTFSPVYHVEGDEAPLQEFYTVGIKVPDTITFPVEKLIVGSRRENGWRYNKSLEVNGYVSAQVREWAQFALVADTVAPSIQVGGYKDSMLFSGNGQITFMIRDNFGLQSVNAYIDGEWVLIPYHNKKGKHVLYATEPVKKKGYRTVEIEAVDVRENKTTWKGVIRTP